MPNEHQLMIKDFGRSSLFLPSIYYPRPPIHGMINPLDKPIQQMTNVLSRIALNWERHNHSF